MEDNGYSNDSMEMLEQHMQKDTSFINDALVPESKDKKNEIQRKSDHYSG